MVIVTGKTTVPKAGPGEYAKKELTIEGTTTDGICVLTLAERDSKFDTRGQPEFWAACTADTVTITCEEEQLKDDTDIFYFVDTDGSGATGGGGGIDYYDIWGDGTLGLNLLSGIAQTISPAKGAARVSVADFVKAVYGGTEPYIFHMMGPFMAPPTPNEDPHLVIGDIMCDDVGIVVVEIVVEDSSTPVPQSAVVQTFIDVQDNMGACGGP